MARVEQDRRLLQFGTFDVRNYGDLLFPLIARHRLEPLGYTIVPVSPTNLDVGWSGTVTPISFGEAIQLARGDFEGILIGGGNIIHNRKVRLAEYAERHLDKGAYLSLWVGATLLAALRDVPIVWNAPGVNLAFTELEGTNFVSVTTAAADMIAVRDERSRANLSGGPTSDVAVVPDTALDIDRVWPKARLADVFRRLLERKEAPVDRPFVAFHIKKRSLGGLSVQRVVEMLDEFAGRVPALPILLALGPCHGDDVFARELSEKLGRPHVLLDDPQGIEEIASAIAGSVLYLGSSLHGYITAYAYEIPSLLVTVPRLDKFEGFLEQIDRVEDACADWVEAFDKAAAYNAAPRPYDKRRAAAARAALDRHWSSLVEALGDKERRRSARRDFLYGAADLILSRSDWGSLSEPFVHQAG